MSNSDQISIAHTKIDKFDSILLINHIIKSHLRLRKTSAFFKIKTANLFTEFKLDYETFPANIPIQSPSQIKKVELVLRTLHRKTFKISQKYFQQLRVYNSQFQVVDNLKLTKVPTILFKIDLAESWIMPLASNKE